MVEREAHVGELVLVVSAGTPEGVYAEVLRGLGQELAADDEGGAPAGDPERRPLALVSSGPETLLADVLNEALFLAETQGLLPVGAEVASLAGGTLRGTLLMVRPAVAPRPVVKAATYHDLEVAHVGGGWRARVVLDV